MVKFTINEKGQIMFPPLKYHCKHLIYEDTMCMSQYLKCLFSREQCLTTDGLFVIQ